MFRPVTTAILLSLILLFPALVIASSQKPRVVVKAISAVDQKNQMSRDKRWMPLNLLNPPGPGSLEPLRFNIEGKTFFYALFLDPLGNSLNQPVVFTWHYGNPLKLYGRAVAKTVRRWPERKTPAAWHSIWSQPPSGKGLLGGMGLGSVKSRADWEKSRCYGPRVVRVWTLKGHQTSTDGRRIPLTGKLLAEKYFKVYPRGGVTY